MRDQLNSVEIKIEAAPGPDLMGMIEEIRAQYEKLAAQNKMEAEDMIKARVAKAQDQAQKDAGAIRDFKEQVGEYRKTVQTLHMEIDSLRSAVSCKIVVWRKILFDRVLKLKQGATLALNTHREIYSVTLYRHFDLAKIATSRTSSPNVLYNRFVFRTIQ